MQYMIAAMENALKQYKEASLLGSVSALLSWDMETMMPSGAAESRSEMISLISQLIHRKMTEPRFVEQVSNISIEKLTGLQKRQAELLKFSVLKQNAFDEKFVKKLSELTVMTHEKWKTARKENNFKLVEANLQQLMLLKREEAETLQSNPHLKQYYQGRSKYEILLDEFEAEFPVARLRSLLETLCNNTKEILPAILEKTASWKENPNASFIMPLEQQNILGQKISAKLGLDYSKARLDSSVHPFCTGFNQEIRITTRHDLQDFTESLLGVIHETGHALYEQNLPSEWNNTPIGVAVSLGVHESQSRFMENMIARSAAFCRFLSKETNIDAHTLFQKLNRVEKSFIRTEADEVTYNLHIALRMRTEEALIEGKIEAKDLPAFWNAEFEKTFGLKVPNDAIGCMQDTHWYHGAFGYFPTYSLGNLFAAALFLDFTRENPNWEQEVEKGNFSAVQNFLREKVHKYASTMNSSALMKQALGRDLSANDFHQYIKQKFEV